MYGTNFSPESISLNNAKTKTSYRSRMKEKLLREGGIIEAVDDTVSECSASGPPDDSGGVSNNPVYSMTSPHQAYTVTSLSAIKVEEVRGHMGVQLGVGGTQPS